MDAKNLSKQKYIYRIYESRDGKLHCEKYPIIYVNSMVVYFKDGRKNGSLGCTYIENILDDTTTINPARLAEEPQLYRCRFNRYFWKVDEEKIEEIFEDLTKQYAALSEVNRKRWFKQRYEQAKIAYEIALEDYKKYGGEDNV